MCVCVSTFSVFIFFIPPATKYAENENLQLAKGFHCRCAAILPCQRVRTMLKNLDRRRAAKSRAEQLAAYACHAQLLPVPVSQFAG